MNIHHEIDAGWFIPLWFRGTQTIWLVKTDISLPNRQENNHGFI